MVQKIASNNRLNDDRTPLATSQRLQAVFIICTSAGEIIYFRNNCCVVTLESSTLEEAPIRPQSSRQCEGL
jgi:hypothetical protein